MISTDKSTARVKNNTCTRTRTCTLLPKSFQICCNETIINKYNLIKAWSLPNIFIFKEDDDLCFYHTSKEVITSIVRILLNWFLSRHLFPLSTFNIATLSNLKQMDGMLHYWSECHTADSKCDFTQLWLMTVKTLTSMIKPTHI